MRFPDGVETLVSELRAKLGVSGVLASTITLHFSDDGKVQKIVPEVVATTGTDGMLSVNYVALLPIVVKGVQEQQQIVRDQQARIQKQEERIAALERARGMKMSSVLTGDLGQGTTLGLFAVAISILLRRRDRNGTPANS